MQQDELLGAGFTPQQAEAILKGGDIHDGTAFETFPERTLAAGSTTTLPRQDLAFFNIKPAAASARYELPENAGPSAPGGARLYSDGDRIVLVQQNATGALVRAGESVAADATHRGRFPRREYVRWRGAWYPVR